MGAFVAPLSVGWAHACAETHLNSPTHWCGALQTLPSPFPVHWFPLRPLSNLYQCSIKKTDPFGSWIHQKRAELMPCQFRCERPIGYSIQLRLLLDLAMGDEDFEEEEVWAAVRETKDENPKTRRTRDFTGSTTSRRLPTPSKMIPRSNASPESSDGVFGQSAPVAIPDWSKIYRHKGSYESHGYRFDDDEAGHNRGKNTFANDDDDEEDDDDDKVPPHEWLAKKMARSQIPSFSMCEGAGRTLKGRDLSKVRNAVLTRTGFLE